MSKTAMGSSGGATAGNWSETVEDLVYGGEIDRAVSFLESVISDLEIEVEKEQVQNKSDGKSRFYANDQLCTALQDLSKLYAAQGLSLRADQTQSRALQLKHRKLGLGMTTESTFNEIGEGRISRDGGFGESSSYQQTDDFPHDSCGDDDWEAIADRAPEELLSPQGLPGVSKLSLEDSKSQGIKRRGRGTFTYKKHGLYSDNEPDEPVFDDDSEDDSVGHAKDPEKRNLMYGTRHVLVLAGLPLSTRTTDLEKMLKKFKDLFVIRWVNDTTALAVFTTPAAALEASNSVQSPFMVRVLEEDDKLLSSIPLKDLEPLRKRPQTSVRTAQRLIAHSMGIKLPSTFGSSELRKQEEARKNRIITRQKMRDDAWGGDDAS